MTTPDLIASLLRQADIASSTDRGNMYREAAERLSIMPALLDAGRFWLEQCGCHDGVNHVFGFDAAGMPVPDHDEPCLVCADTRAAVARAEAAEGLSCLTLSGRG